MYVKERDKTMKTMKKFLCVLLVMMFVLSGCGLGSSNGASAGASSSAGAASSGTQVEALGADATDDEINAFITAASSNPDKMVIKYASTSPDLNGQAYLRAARKFLQTLKEELGDKVEIQYYMNSTFGGSADAVLGGLQNQTFELTDWPLGSFAEFTNAFQPLDVPYLVTNSQESYDLLSGDAGDLMKEKCVSETGLRPLYYGIIGMRQITNSKHEITSPADLKGLKLRAQNNSVQVTGLSALGCSITTMAFSEVFTSLQQGVIDGQENPIETIYNFQYYDVQDYMTITNHLCTAGAVVCNDQWYNGLSDEFKAAVDKAAATAQAYSIEELNASEGEVLKLLSEKMTVTELTDEQLQVFQDQAKTAWPQLVEEIGSDYMTEFLSAAGISIE